VATARSRTLPEHPLGLAGRGERPHFTLSYFTVQRLRRRASPSVHARDDVADDAGDEPGVKAAAAKEGAGPSRLLRRFKSVGIRTATDFEQAYAHASSRAALVARFGADAPRLELIAFALEDDEWMPQLRSWREFRRTYDTVYTAADLEQTGAPRRSSVAIAPRPTADDPQPPAA
jgi:hypothetical protein